jgi:hypothetical protein
VSSDNAKVGTSSSSSSLRLTISLKLCRWERRHKNIRFLPLPRLTPLDQDPPWMGLSLSTKNLDNTYQI